MECQATTHGSNTSATLSKNDCVKFESFSSVLELEHDKRPSRCSKAWSMRRLISLLMMMVMVLAPCAVVHAANASNHHGPMKQTAGHLLHAVQHVGPNRLLHHQSPCPTGSKHQDFSHCSNDCTTLQRLMSQSTHEAHDLKTEPVDLAVVVPLLDNRIVLSAQSRRSARFRLIEPRRDPLSVLHTTARLRL